MKKSTLITLLAVVVGIVVVLAFYLIFNKKSGSRQLQNGQSQDEPVPSPSEIGETTIDSQPQQRPCVVLFHAEWCGACKGMLPAWRQFVEKMKEGPVDVKEFEHKSNPDIVKQNNIEAFPVVRLYPQGFPSQNYVDYKGNRSAESFFNFVMSGGKSA